METNPKSKKLKTTVADVSLENSLSKLDNFCAQKVAMASVCDEKTIFAP